uniref:X-ray radiation resistance-associated protein 1-like n=1 Tax=Castor canadensis TaxID=51338 RepID=A0A8B7TKF9_CASCN|nr:X-ray radiation resistance-associated protein 1-like [Castor canadensis]
MVVVNFLMVSFFNKTSSKSRAPVAHACNPSYSGGRDQEDRGFKPARAKEKDFKHFSSVIYINASENLLPLEAFHTFPALKELELAFNGIKTVYVKYGDFKPLQFLDLSFNSLTTEAVCDLGILPHLRVLLLTGNGLTSLPPSLAVTEQ